MICIKCKKDAPDAPFCCWCGAKQSATPRSTKKRGNGEGTAYKRGKTWTAQACVYSYLDKDGNRISKRISKGGFPTKKDALAWALSKTDRESKKSPTLLSLWNGWSENDLLKRSKDKQTAYKKARERLEPIIARQIETLTIDDLQTVVNEQANSYYTARDMKSLLSHLYNRALANQFVTVNLSRFIILPELVEKEPEPFSEEEVSAMWTAWENGNTFIGYMLLMIYTSMMPGELFACKKDMIRWKEREIFGCGRKTKKRKEVPIVFPDFIEPVLRKLCDASPKENIQPKWETEWYDDYHAALKEIGVRDLPPYSCRHTTATEAVKKGVSLPVVQQIMRHSKIASTQRYIHVASKEAHEGINALDKSKTQSREEQL